MRHLFACLFLAAAIPLFAVTTVSQHVVNPDGSDASGTVFIKISQACVSGSNYVGNTTKTVKFTGGNFSVPLVPNDTCYLPGSVLHPTTYAVAWQLSTGQSWSETWSVWTSAIPLAVSAVRQAAPVSPVPVDLIPLTQLAQGGAITGQAVVWNGTQWAPGTVSGGGGGGGVWGTIAGNISNQADLTAALAAKQAVITRGTTGQYFRGDLSLATFPTVPILSGSGVLKGSGGNAIPAAFSDVVALWSGCSAGYLKYDGTCSTPGGANASGYYWVTQTANAPANAVNLGGLSTGVLKVSVSGGVATPSIAVAGTDFMAANPTVVNVGDGTTSGYIDLYPGGDAIHSVGFTTGTRSTQTRFKLPSTDPSDGQVLSCNAPISNVSTCTWITAGGGGGGGGTLSWATLDSTAWGSIDATSWGTMTL